MINKFFFQIENEREWDDNFLKLFFYNIWNISNKICVILP